MPVNRRGFLAGLLASAAVPTAVVAAVNAGAALPIVYGRAPPPWVWGEPPGGLAYVVFDNFDLSKFEEPPNMLLHIADGAVIGLNGFTFDGERIAT